MYHLGGFPGVVLDGNEEGVVIDVLEVTADGPAAEFLVDRLDGYEGYNPNNHDNSLYLRKVIDTADFGEVSIYEYNRQTEGRHRIPGGDWNNNNAAA